MEVVVTGGAGFIGANLCRALVRAGVERVIVLDDLSTGRATNLAGLTAVELVEASILDPDTLGTACATADAVVHLAARSAVPRSMADPVATHAANATGTVNVLEAARAAPRPPHVVVAGSSSVYGANPAMPKHEGLAPMPISPYGASKLATEAYAQAWARSFGLDVLTFRFFNVYGPLQPPGATFAVPNFVAAALAGTPLPIHGDGRQTRDFTYVDTVTDVLVDAILRRVTVDGPVNLAFGGRASVLDIVEALERIVGHPLQRTHTGDRPGDVRDSQADDRLVRSLFPDVEPVALEDGLRRTVDWLRELA